MWMLFYSTRRRKKNEIKMKGDRAEEDDGEKKKTPTQHKGIAVKKNIYNSLWIDGATVQVMRAVVESTLNVIRISKSPANEKRR